jgi:uncharacterized damage-inducible protein DinB
MDISTLVKSAVGSILDRDLATLRREVEAYADERDLWRTAPGISNTAGTLVLHLTGNLQHYLGAVLGGTGYLRDRPAEFARRGVPRAELIQEIEAARRAVKAGLDRLPTAQLIADYPEAVAGASVATGEFLIHLTTHFAYHLGQVDYHRRTVAGNTDPVGAMRAGELSSARATEVQA